MTGLKSTAWNRQFETAWAVEGTTSVAHDHAHIAPAEYICVYGADAEVILTSMNTSCYTTLHDCTLYLAQYLEFIVPYLYDPGILVTHPSCMNTLMHEGFHVNESF